MPQHHQLSIIIVHWNTPKTLDSQLEKLSDVGTNTELIVVDNNSDQSLSQLKKKYSSVTWIENSYNRGFAAACNQATLRAGGKWLLFLNPDVMIDDKFINKYIAYANSHNLKACSPQSKSEDYSKPLPSFWSLLWEFSPLKHILPRSIFQSQTLLGGCLLVNANVLKNLGGWDERFFLWFEDSDLTKRLIDADQRIGFFPQFIEHRGGESFKHLPTQFKKNTFFNSLEVYLRKHEGGLTLWLIKLITNRFRTSKLLSIHNSDLTSITVPNLKLELAESFLKQNWQFFDHEHQEVILVSSGIDSSQTWQLRKQFPNLRVIPITKNRGFAATVNIGWRASSGNWIGTVNDDTSLKPNWVGELTQTGDQKIGAINPIIFDQSNQIESAGVSIEKKGKAIPITNASSKQYQLVDALNGAALVCRKEALAEVGIFDEKFGSYLEDIDLSLRIAKRDWKNIVNSRVSITHFRHQTMNTKSILKAWLDCKNWWLVMIKNWSLADWLIHLPQILLERARNLSGLIKSI